MPNTYTSLIFHVIFSTHGRRPLLDDAWRQDLHAYMGGTLDALGGQLLCAGGVEDHVHLLILVKPAMALSKTVGTIKANSARWLNGGGRVDGGFRWQRGYAAFSVGIGQVPALRAYIDRQREHHAQVSYRDEVSDALVAHGVRFEERFLFD